MARQQFIDQIYHLVKSEYNNQTFIFEDVWKKIIKESKLSKEEQRQNIGVVYTDLLQDARFVYTGNKKWMLREFATQEEIANFHNALYDFNTDVIEEGHTTVPPVENVGEGEENIDEKEIAKDEEEDIEIKPTLEKIRDEEEE